MTIYYQHIGESLWRRDAPKSIGTSTLGLKRFSVTDIEPYLASLDAYEMMSIRSKVDDLAPTGFQIWGIPQGAQRVLASMDTADYLMLLESTDFAYVGQVIHRISQPCWDLSRHIWGEQRFPIIILLQGELITYPWRDFREQFDFDQNYHMRGNTMRLSEERVGSSSFVTEEAFIAKLLTTTGVTPGDLEKDFQAFANNLEVHFRLVKTRAAQQAFRREVLNAQGNCCAVCDIAFPVVLEAAHIVPKEHEGTDDARNGLALCALHHRMLDGDMFTIHPKTLVIHPAMGVSLADLRIIRSDLKHLARTPHKDALQWRWDAVEKKLASAIRTE